MIIGSSDLVIIGQHITVHLCVPLWPETQDWKVLAAVKFGVRFPCDAIEKSRGHCHY